MAVPEGKTAEEKKSEIKKNISLPTTFLSKVNQIIIALTCFQERILSWGCLFLDNIFL